MSAPESNGLVFSAADYAKSPIHLAIALRDHTALRRILATLPKPPPPGSVKTEEESIRAEERADRASRVIDFRDVSGRETPLALAVRIGDTTAVDMLMQAGADASLTNAEGWAPLQEAVCKGDQKIAAIILRYYQITAWSKYMRRLPSLSATMRKMRNFYMEIHWKFESSVIPFITRIAPSDTYRIWKKGSCLRADLTLAGFEGLRIKRRRQSVLFFGDGIPEEDIAPGSLIILKHEKKEKFHALEGADKVLSEAEMAKDVKGLFQANMYKGGIDVTKAKVTPVLTWRGSERTETICGYKTVIYEMRDVNLKLKSRRVPGAPTNDDLFPKEKRGAIRGEAEDAEHAFFLGNKEVLDEVLTEEEKLQLQAALDKQKNADNRLSSEESEEEEENKIANYDWEKSDDDEKNESKTAKDRSKNEPGETNDKEKSGWLWKKKKGKLKDESKDSSKEKSGFKKSASSLSSMEDEEAEEKGKEKDKLENEWKKGLKPTLWLTHDFPLEMTELMPLLDLLAKKVKAVKRLQELLMTKLPPGTVPIKVAIPIVPTIRVSATFSKFEEIRPFRDEDEEEDDDFSTPVGSPSREDGDKASKSTWMSWWGGKQASDMDNQLDAGVNSELALLEGYDQPVFNPFQLPDDYRWVDVQERKKREREKRKQRAKNKSREKIENQPL